jgi:iron complex outermembrane receptor protein
MSFLKYEINKWFIIFLVVAFLPEFARAQNTEYEPQVLQFARMNLRQLINMKITSVSKKEERYFDASAAVYVITNEDIRRTGATSVMDALRMAPGLEVANFSSNSWAISSRGFNEIFANKLLVLIDGRSIYSMVFSGVNWGNQDIMTEDIDRIEIIRGPGASLWGANAVNGVINIITKSSQKTQDGLVTGGVGNLERGFSSVRYGGKLDNGITYRAFGKYTNKNANKDISGNDAFDDWEVARGGFRFDWDKSSKDSFTLQGDYYSGRLGFKTGDTLNTITPPTTLNSEIDNDIQGTNILGRWTRSWENQSKSILQFYYDLEDRRPGSFNSIVNTFDIDLQHEFHLGDSNHIVMGAEVRTIADNFENSLTIQVLPDNRVYTNGSAFIQDTIDLIPNTLSLTLGSKFEITAFTGFEIEPNARLAWSPNSRHRFWASVSRAVNLPDRLDEGGRIRLAPIDAGNGTGIDVSIFPNPNEESEELIAYEAGYRVKPVNSLFFDFTAYYNKYDKLFDTTTGAFTIESDPSPAHLVLPVTANNNRDSEVYGFEAAAQWEPTAYWQLKGSFTWLNVNLFPNDDNAEDNDPDVQWNMRSFLDLPYNFEFDTMVYFVGALPNQEVPSYTRLDVRLGWLPDPSLELSIAVQNIQDSQHPESERGKDVTLATSTEVPRSVYGKAKWLF